MSHSYHLRPNVKGRMQRRLDAHVAAFGAQNRDKIVAKLSETGQGVHLFFDPERSLSPEPGRVIEPQFVNTSEEVVAAEASYSSSSDSELSSLDTIIDETYCSEYWPGSPPQAPKAPRCTRQGNWQEESAPSSHSAVDSMAALAERRQARHVRFDVEQARQSFVEEQRRKDEPNHPVHEQQVEQAERDRREQIVMLRRDYEQRVARFREERAELFGSQDQFEGEQYAAGETVDTGAGNSSPEFPHPLAPSPQSGAGPSLGAPGRRHEAEQIVAPKSRQQDGAALATRSAPDRPFVVVAKRVPKLGPCGTMVIDHETGMQMVETRRYRVRADELESVDEDGDSVMGSDEYYVCDSSAM
jgi:hypothetical protein